MKKKLLLILLTIFGFANLASAQIQEEKYYFYVPKGIKPKEDTKMTCVKFNGNYRNCILSTSQFIRDNIDEFYRLMNRKDHESNNTPYYYDKENSTKNTIVYSRYYNGHYIYNTFSLDKSSMTYTYSDNNKKEEYIRVNYDIGNPSSYPSIMENIHSSSINNNSSPNKKRNSSNPDRQNQSTHTCSLCHGLGKIIRNSSIPTYGTDTKVFCSICNRSFYRSTGHSHVTCPTCHGKGAL